MKIAISAMFVIGVTALAGAQVAAPTVVISAEKVDSSTSPTILSGVTISVNGVEIRADSVEMREGELNLRNATVRFTSQGGDFIMRLPVPLN